MMTLRSASTATRRCPRALGLITLVLGMTGTAAPVRSAGPPPRPSEISGTVRDVAGAPVGGAHLDVDGVAAGESSADGSFRIQASAGSHRLEVSAAGFTGAVRSVEVGAAVAPLEIVLQPALRVSEDLVVRAVRAESATPVAKSELEGERIAKLAYGQEMPFLLASTPSVASYSESGLALGAGYSYFSLRGIAQSRLNMTFDGVPLNDPEESAVYFANFGDFASAVGSVQVQRGVGTSTFGAAAYGGAVSFGSVELAEAPRLSVELAGGSYGTERGSVRYETGRLGSGLALYGRYSALDSDGYRDHSGMRQRTLFLGGDWRGGATYVRFFGFSGREHSQLSFYAVEPWVLEKSPRFNPMQPEETDSFGQDLAYLQVGRAVGDRGEVAVQLYTSGADGSLLLFDDPVAKSGRREIGIDGRTLGTLLTGSLRGDGWQLSTGLQGATFARDHYAWLGGARQYANTGRKRELSGFAKLAADLGPAQGPESGLKSGWHLFADLQVRHASFRYDGSIDLGPVAWTFVNPRLGVRLDLSEAAGIYASVGRAEREPARNDLLEGEDDLTSPVDLRAVEPEQVVDFELGADVHTDRLSLQVNLYDMEFRNEIAATGEQSALGYAIRRNLPRSSRRGIEVELLWKASRSLTLRATGNLARNRIERWTQELDLYDAAGTYLGRDRRTFRNTRPSLSPEQIVSASLAWHPLAPLEIELSGRRVGRSQLDNTGDPRLSADPYGWADLSVRMDLARWVPVGKAKVRLQVGNFLDAQRVWPSGYSYPYLVADGAGEPRLDGVPYYYPAARRHLVLGLELTF